MNTTLYVKRFESTASADVTEDVSLPDYLPEVRRIVGVHAAVTVDGKYLSGEELEADGNVVYTVLYTTADGSLAQISESTSYTGHIPLKNDDFGSEDIVLTSSVDNVTCRVTAPRKITLSSRVKLSASAGKPVDGSLHVSDTAGDTTVRRKVKSVRTGYMTEIRQSGEAEGEIREREGMRLICASGSISADDVRVVPGSGDGTKKILVKGNVSVNLLLLSPDGMYVQSKGRAPFEEEMSFDERNIQGMTVEPTAFVRIVMIEVSGSEDGIFTWKAEYDAECVLMRCTEAEITADAYLAEREDTLVRNEFSVCSPAAAVNGRLTVSAAIPLRQDCVFITAWGSACADKAEISGMKMNLSGSAKLSVVTAGNGEFFFDEVNVPVKYTCEALDKTDGGGDTVGRTSVDVCDITARADGNTLNLTAELFISAALLTEHGEDAAVTLSPSEDTGRNIPAGRNKIRVYIPDRGESAWDVEKKFRLGCDAVREGEAYVI